MFTTLLVIGGVLVGLLLLLVLIVRLSARPASVNRTSDWTAQTGRPHPDAWSPPAATSELPTVR